MSTIRKVSQNYCRLLHVILMKVTETTSQPASLLQKEVHSISFSEITSGDYAELQRALDHFFVLMARRKCILDVSLGWTNVWLKNEREADLFATGFRTAMQLGDPDFGRL